MWVYAEVPPLRGVVSVLGGAHLHSRLALGVKALMDINLLNALLLIKVPHRVVGLLILEVHLHVILMLM